MNVGIITQPLVANYGGFLQNFAMQKALEEMGCTPITLDLETHLNTSYVGYLRYIASLFLKNAFKGSKQAYANYYQVRPNSFDEFVIKNIKTTSKLKKYSRDVIKDYNLDCLLVGSDQVWRPKFNVFPEDMFLAFAKEDRIRRVSYAASFGVDNWEFNPELTKTCCALAQKFDAISVRESSGISLCANYLNVKAEKVLDPTLLHDVQIYNELSKEVPQVKKQYVAVYALGLNDAAKAEIRRLAENEKMEVEYFTSDAGFTLSVPEWVAMIRDASFVITDSFHGTAFSIIYNKNFYSITNNSRGASRFESILADFDLSDRLINSNRLELPDIETTINWESVNKKLEARKVQSKEFLYSALFGRV